jgi:menaquinone-specific isochorismate synthase
MSSAPVTTGASLRAVTREIAPPDDVLGALGDDGVAWLHDGASFASSGVVARVRPDDAVGFLAAVEHDADPALPGTGPIAVGALPFEPTAVGELVVPACIVGRTADGRGWRTEIGGNLRVTPERADPPARYVVSASSTHDAWRTAVERALAEIDAGHVTKVVLARAVDVEADQDFDVAAVLARLRNQQPGCFVYAASGMVGASPELLIARHGSTVVSRPLAGTAVIGDQDVEDLRASAKDGNEHRIVVQAIVEALEPWCAHLDAPDTPEVDTFADVAHLATPVYGTLRDPAPDALTLVRALHPTPAVGGTPTDAALEVITRLETDPRGAYAGPVGWIDARGDGEWAVALRGAAVNGRRARLHAGAGIVPGSDPEAEWIETQAKLEPMLRALVRP